MVLGFLQRDQPGIAAVHFPGTAPPPVDGFQRLRDRGYALTERRMDDAIWAVQLDHPTQLAEVIFAAAEPLLKKEANGTPYRLIGVGLSHLGPAAGDQSDLFEPDGNKRARVERAMDAVRAKLGKSAIGTGRGLKS